MVTMVVVVVITFVIIIVIIIIVIIIMFGYPSLYRLISEQRRRRHVLSPVSFDRHRRGHHLGWHMFFLLVPMIHMAVIIFIIFVIATRSISPHVSYHPAHGHRLRHHRRHDRRCRHYHMAWASSPIYLSSL